MLHYAVVFFVIALIAAVFGFGGIAVSAVVIAKILFVVFAVLAIDSVITTAVKGRMVDNPNVDAAAIKVETMKGTVMLSGFAKSATERSVAESLAWKTTGVKAVKNEIAIRP